jgi:hypothetical protein
MWLFVLQTAVDIGSERFRYVAVCFTDCSGYWEWEVQVCGCLFYRQQTETDMWLFVSQTENRHRYVAVCFTDSKQTQICGCLFYRQQTDTGMWLFVLQTGNRLSQH